MEKTEMKKLYESPEFEVCKVNLIPDALNTPSRPDNENWDWGNDDEWGGGGEFNPDGLDLEP